MSGDPRLDLSIIHLWQDDRTMTLCGIMASELYDYYGPVRQMLHYYECRGCLTIVLGHPLAPTIEQLQEIQQLLKSRNA